SVLSSEYNTFNQLSLPPTVKGLESAAFDRGGEGPYVIVADGRILKWKGPSIGFVDFAYTSRNRTKNLCDGFNGGLATQLPGGYKYLSGIDVESYTRNVYLTDASLTFDIRNMAQPGFKLDSTGRLLKYDPRTQRVTTLLSGLSIVGGPAVSSDRKYVLVPEYGKNRIQRRW
nr:protein strictosidine synthase-like 11-like [Tanacetum cinerariifolium]